MDIDECKVKNGGCSTKPKTNCTNYPPGTHSCSKCPSGYSGNGRLALGGCKDIDECANVTDSKSGKSYRSKACDVHSKCINLVPGFKCGPCAVGYKGTGLLGCKDIDECDSNPCYHNAKCVSSLNSYTCVCTSAWCVSLQNVAFDSI